MRMDGEVITGIVGADAQRGRWPAGLALSVSEGEGTDIRHGRPDRPR